MEKETRSKGERRWKIKRKRGEEEDWGRSRERERKCE